MLNFLIPPISRLFQNYLRMEAEVLAASVEYSTVEPQKITAKTGMFRLSALGISFCRSFTPIAVRGFCLPSHEPAW
jgi:hypothetical protein